MAKYQAYPEYKDSGVEGLVTVPVHWELSKLRYKFSFGKGLTITKENLQDEGIPCVNYGEVHSKYGFEVDPQVNSLKCVSEKYLKGNENSLLLKGDIIFADTSEDLEGSGNFTQLTSDTRTFAGYHTIIARPFKRGNSRFYAYLLDCQELRVQVRNAVKGVKVFSVTQAILRTLSIWLPSENEQQRISTFLDHETVKIDNLIERQQQLIELLKEKRQAVISHAVTKGLNPDVPMKDSGVEWLGEVPEHWIIPKIGYFCEVTKLTGFEYTNHWRTDENGEIIALRGFNIKERYLDLARAEKISNELSRKLSRSKLSVGDIVLPCTGTLGNACIIRSNNMFHINQNIAKLTFDESIYSEFAAYWLTSEPFREMIEFNNTSGMQPVLLIGDIRNMPMPLPSIQEQIDISIYLNNKLNVYDFAIQQNEHAISLLSERRTALISAAVTGKIDVRNWVAPEAEKAEVSQEATA